MLWSGKNADYSAAKNKFLTNQIMRAINRFTPVKKIYSKKKNDFHDQTFQYAEFEIARAKSLSKSRHNDVKNCGP